MPRRILLLIFCLSLSFSAFCQQSDATAIKKLYDYIMSKGEAYENLRYLCKQIGPRLSGSDNAEKAVIATAAMLKKAGADTVYLQPCMVPHWVRGAKEAGYIQLTNGKKSTLHLCALGNSIGTDAAGVRGKVIEVNSMEALHRLGRSAVQGKIVFFNIPMNPLHLNTFQAYGESGIGRWDGPAQAAKYGALGAVVRSLASNEDDYPHTGSTSYNDSFPKIPAVAISTKDATLLSVFLQKDKALSIWFKTNCQMLADKPSFNVIGEIRGTEYPDEIITVGGHLDSWDLGEGAHDDGAGCVQSIEVINAFQQMGIRPKRTVRAVMFMNEENGGRGGDAYLAFAQTHHEKHVFALESDEGGFTPRFFSFDVPTTTFNRLTEWKSLLYPYGVYDFVQNGSGSDIEPLKALGTSLAALHPDSQRYFDVHHAASDRFESVSKRELMLGAANIAALIYLVSEHGL